MIRDIYREIAVKSGLSPEAMNFLRPDRFGYFELEICEGSYGPQYNIILLDPEVLLRTCGETNVNMEHIVLNIICHEEGHAVGRTECYGVVGEHGNNYRTVVGYSDVVPGKGNRRKRWFGLWEEGVNEKLARVVFRECISRLNEKIDAEQIKKLEANSYTASIELVEYCVNRIAKENQLRAETVWEAIVRGKFEPWDKRTPEWLGLMKDALPDWAMEKLRTAITDKQIANILRALKKPALLTKKSRAPKGK